MIIIIIPFFLARKISVGKFVHKKTRIMLVTDVAVS